MRVLHTLAKKRRLRTNLLIGALLLAAVVFAGIGESHKSFKSVEVAFTDNSQSGLSIVPASCPSNPGDLDAPYGCSGALPLCPNGSTAPNSDVNQCTCSQGNTNACGPSLVCSWYRQFMGIVGPGCATCPNGDLAPGNDASQCTCAQGNTTMCARCPNGSIAPNNDASQCTCAQGNTSRCPVCGSGQTLVNGACVSTSCISGQILVNGTCQSCPQGQIAVNGACVPALCPAGQHAVGQVCVCDATNLPADSNGQCTGQVCPSGYQWDPGTGQCIIINSCVLPPVCSDSTHVLNQCTGAVSNCALNGAGWSCVNGQCVQAPPPIASIITSSKLVPQGTVVTVTWTSQNTTSCTASGNNGSGPWSGTAGTQSSDPVTAQTVFTLSCHGVDGSTITKSVTVNIIPTFIET